LPSAGGAGRGMGTGTSKLKGGNSESQWWGRLGGYPGKSHFQRNGPLQGAQGKKEESLKTLGSGFKRRG